MDTAALFVGSGRGLKGRGNWRHFIDVDEALGASTAVSDRDRSLRFGRLVKSMFTQLVETNSDRAVFLVTQETEKPIRLLGSVIKRALPELPVVFSGPDLDLEGAIKDLKAGLIDRIIRADDGLPLASDLEGSERACVLFRHAEGMIQWEKAARSLEEGERVLLVLMPAWGNDCPPFGLAHIAGALKEAGHATDVLDLNWHFWKGLRSRFPDCSRFVRVPLWSDRERYVSEARPLLDEVFSRLREKIESGRYRYFGFSLFDTNLNASEDAFELIRRLAPEAKIFCGGPTCLSDWAAGALSRDRIDGAVFGEGEVSVTELIGNLKAGREDPIPGTHRRGKDGLVIQGGPRPLANINALPAPDFSGFNLYDYDYLRLPIHFGRGCVAKCAFCSETQYWVRFRVLSPERLIETIQGAVHKYGITSFQFNDSLMNGSHRHLEKFVDLVLEQGLKISFRGYCRLDGELTDALLEKMARAGCRGISFGMESGSQRVTDLMRKEVDVRNYERIIKQAHQTGIPVSVCVIVGFPGETWRDFLKTALLIFRLRSYIEMLNLSVMGLSTNSLVSMDLESFGIHSDAVGSWRTKDGSSTPRVRKLRYWLLNRFWRWARGLRTSPGGWSYQG